MIDLSRTRAGLLTQIEAPDPAGGPLTDITDPRVATGDAHVRVCGRTREDLFPVLKLALSERFAAVPRMELLRDLLMPLRNALGNAFKHGNGSDPSKSVSVEIVFAQKGALIAITDEGVGFDVALTFRRFQEQERYFENEGSGFTNLHRAMSTVSYENDGRTLLVCFQCASSCPASVGDPSTDPGASSGEAHALPKVPDSVRLSTCLSAELAKFAGGCARIESCRVYVTRGCAGGDGESRYLLRVAGACGGPAETRILTGRLHAKEAAAKADFAAATLLHEAKILKSVRIPRPVARPEGEPRLVLYDFDPWMNLREYLRYQRSPTALQHCASRVGRALAHLHRSQIVFPNVQTDLVEDGLQGVFASAETCFQSLPAGSDLVSRFRASVQQIRERAASGRPPTRTPIHGALGWHCIHYGVDGRFYLYRFETCRRSDPGLDLGGFAADLLCFTLADHDTGAYRLGSDAFLRSYNSRAEYPLREDELRPYIALALFERLRRLEPPASTQAGQLLAALHAVLSHRGGGVASEVSA